MQFSVEINEIVSINDISFSIEYKRQDTRKRNCESYAKKRYLLFPNLCIQCVQEVVTHFI